MRFVLRSVATAALAAIWLAIPAQAANPNRLDAYRVPAKGQQIEDLAKLGYDVTEGRSRGAVTVVATPTQASKLRLAGFKPSFVRDRKGRTVRQARRRAGGLRLRRVASLRRPGLQQGRPARGQHPDRAREARGGAPRHHQEGGHRPFDQGPADHRAEGDQGRPHDQGRQPPDGPLLRHTARARVDRDRGRPAPAALLRRQLRQRTTTRQGTARSSRPLVNTRELWFVVVCNPDGYDYTFSPPTTACGARTCATTTATAQITDGDGVDPNRNFADEVELRQRGLLVGPGERDLPRHGPGLRARDQGARRPDAAHQAGRVPTTTTRFAQLLLYPIGWQVETPTADDPLFVALTGVRRPSPRSRASTPTSSAELYTTNGETTDHAYTKYGTLALDDRARRRRHRPGRERLRRSRTTRPTSQAEFAQEPPVRARPRHVGGRPGQPGSSHLGNRAPDFSVDAFDVSYGDPQAVEVDAKRELGDVKLQATRSTAARERSASTTEWRGGERFGGDERRLLPPPPRHGDRGQARATT